MKTKDEVYARLVQILEEDFEIESDDISLDANLYQDSFLIKVTGTQSTRSAVILARVRNAKCAAPRWNLTASPGVVRVPSGNIMRLFPCASERSQSLTKSSGSSLLK